MATEAQIKIVIDSSQANKSVATLQSELKKANAELTKSIKIYGENSKQADTARKSVAGLEVEIGKLNAASKQVVGSQQSLKAELRQLQNELAGLEPGSQRFLELSQRAGELRDRIQDTNNVINATAGTGVERFGKAIGAATQIGIAGFQGLMGIQAVFGIENEDLQQQMVKLTGLLNLSQAITSFGSIGDKFTELKAGIVPVITEMYSFIAAETAAAGASGTLAIAMNAIPFVALATGIGLAVYSIYDYVSTSKEAAKEEEKRKKRLAELKKRQDEEAKSVAQSSSEFLTLIIQLKATNKNSERRKELIKDINKQYGTTLQNLSDENQFQAQLNATVREYITLQYNKFKLQKNQEYIDKSNEKRFKAEQEQARLLKIFNKERFEAGTTLVRFNNALNANEQITLKSAESLKDYRDRNDDFNKQLLAVEKALREVETSQNNLGLTREKLLKVDKELTNNGKVYVKQNEETSSSTEDVADETEKYAEVLRLAQYELSRLSAFQETQSKLENDRITNTLEKDKKSIETKYGDERKKLIEKSLEEQLRLEEEKFKKEGKTTEEWKTREAAIRKQADEEIVANRVGIFTESELKVFQAIETYRQEDINNLINTYNTKEQITLAQTEQILANTRLVELQHQKKVELEDVENLKLTEEEKNKKKLEIRQKYGDAEIQLIKDEADRQQEILDLQLRQTLADTTKTDAEKQQAQAKYSDDTVKLAQDTRDKINEIYTGIKTPIPSTEEEINKAVDKAKQYTEKIAEVWGQLSSTITAYQEQQNKERQALITEQFDNEKKVLDEQLKNEIISREQYEYELDRIESDREKKETDLKKKAFEQQKKIQIVNATIQGAQAILSAYSSGVATPLIGPATGAIYAAIAAAFAAAQIQQINSQQFTAAQGGIVPGNGSGSIDSVPSLLAPGEFVINSNSASMYPNLLSQINESGGGKKLVPDLPPVSNSQTTPNVFVNQQSNQPIKAYVVETDISESQRRINRIKQSVEF